MRKLKLTKLLASTGLAMIVGATTGCQTQIAGMTLPSPYYLEHPPQYFPQEPDFPLTRELATQEAQSGLLSPRENSAPAGPIPGAAGPAPAPMGGMPPGM